MSKIISISVLSLNTQVSPWGRMEERTLVGFFTYPLFLRTRGRKASDCHCRDRENACRCSTLRSGASLIELWREEGNQHHTLCFRNCTQVLPFCDTQGTMSGLYFPKMVDIIAAIPETHRNLLNPYLKVKPVRTASGVAVVVGARCFLDFRLLCVSLIDVRM